MTDIQLSAARKMLNNNPNQAKHNNYGSLITTEWNEDKYEMGKNSLNTGLRRKPSLRKAATQWLLHTIPESSHELLGKGKSTLLEFRKQSKECHYQLDIKPEDYAERQLDVRRFAICDEIERRVINSGESLRFLRRNLIVYDNLHKWNLL